MNYGPEASRDKGDPNSYQIFFIKVPASAPGQLYLKIFDIDCGKSIDRNWGQWDTKTLFSFYGGAGVFSKESNLIPVAKPIEPFSGELIKEKSTKWNGLLDNYWYPLTNFKPEQGELIDGYYYFKLVVKGIEGNDANVFDVAVSTSISENLPVEGVKILTYAPTIRLIIHQKAVQLRFKSPEKDSVIILHNFDADEAGLILKTPFRSDIRLGASENGKWLKKAVTLKSYELNSMCAIEFGTGGKTINTATFYVTDSKNNPLFFELPVWTPKENSRPVISHHEKYLSDCRSVEFDGCSSSDKENDPIEFYWKFSDGTADNGCKVIHEFPGSGVYSVRLIVCDGSGQIENSALTNFKVTINNQPATK
ncbi:MAG: PKD domain-containing protein [Ignavibacteria bacterium]